MDASKSKPRAGLEGLPRFLEGFTAYHLRVRFVAEREVAFGGKWYFLPRFALGNALMNSPRFAHLYTELFKPETQTGADGRQHTSASRLVVRADRPTRRGLARREPLDLYITIVVREARLVEDFLAFLPEWQGYNFMQEHGLSYHSYQLLSPKTGSYESGLKAEAARLDVDFFWRQAPEWVEGLSVRFLTPTTLRLDQLLSAEIPLSRLLNRISRRLYELYTQCLASEGEPRVEPFVFAERNDLVLSEVSLPQSPTIKAHRQYDMSGILGQLHYRTPYDPVAALMLSVAHWVHIGTHTVSGNGQILARGTNTECYNNWISFLKQDLESPFAKQDQEQFIIQLRSLTYIPEKYHVIKIPKSNGSYRELHIPGSKDLYLQKTLVQIIQPLLDSKLSFQAYAYRKGKGAIQAIRAIDAMQRRLAHTSYYVIRCDIDDFFDSVSVEMLMSSLQQTISDPLVIRMINLWLKSSIVDAQGNLHSSSSGLPQGSPLSPPLSNLYLADTDQYIWNNITKNFIRYADDILLFISEDRDPLSALQSLSDHLKIHRKLCLNKDFTVTSKGTEFSFLGITFCPNGDKEMSRVKKGLLEEKLTTALYQDTQQYVSLKKTIQGIQSYYQKLVKKVDIAIVDEKAADIYASFVSKIKQPSERKNTINKLVKVGFLSEKRGRDLLQKAMQEKGKTSPPRARVVNESIMLRKQLKNHLQNMEDRFEVVISEPGSFIGINGSHIVVRKLGKVVSKSPASQVEQISIICQGVSFSSNIASYCQKRNIRIVYYDNLGRAYAAVTGANTALPSIMKAQMQLDSARIREFIEGLVQNKIKNQIKLLKYYRKYFRREEVLSSSLGQTIEQMTEVTNMPIRGNDIEEFRQNAMLLEARAARPYWGCFGELVRRTGHPFDGRAQKGAQDIVNQMLNYGYAILQSYVMRTIDVWQLNPNIGLLHSTRDNAPALCFDLMEQYRSFVVDRSILAILSKREEVGQAKDGSLNIATRTRIISKIRERFFALEYHRSGDKILSEIMNMQTREVRDFCLGKVNKIRFYTPKW